MQSSGAANLNLNTASAISESAPMDDPHAPPLCRSGRSLLSGFALLLAVISAGCDNAVRFGEETSNGTRVLRHEVPIRGGQDALVQGELAYDQTHDCFLLQRDGASYPVVWPAGTEGTANGPGVRLPDGTTVRLGDQVAGGGGYHRADAYLEDVTLPAECVPASGQVAVFNATEVLEVGG